MMEDNNDDDDGWETVPKKKKKDKKKKEDNSLAQQEAEGGGSFGYTLPWVSYIAPTKQNTNFTPYMILLCGIPGSGKSTFAYCLQKAMPYKFVRINQDDLGGSRQRCEILAREVLQQNKCPIIDRCNFNKEQREHFIAIASEFQTSTTKTIPVDCIVLGIDTLVTVDECIHRCQARKNHPTLKANEARGVVIGMAQQLKPPPPSRNQEGIRNVKYIENPNGFNDTIVEYLNKSS